MSYLKRWKGTTTIRACSFPKADKIIHTDIGALRQNDGRVWGIGAYAVGTGEYLAESWPKEIFEEALVAKSNYISTPFLELYGAMAAS